MEVIRVKIVGLKIEYKSCSKKAAIYLIICIFNVQCVTKEKTLSVTNASYVHS